MTWRLVGPGGATCLSCRSDQWTRGDILPSLILLLLPSHQIGGQSLPWGEQFFMVRTLFINYKYIARQNFQKYFFPKKLN